MACLGAMKEAVVVVQMVRAGETIWTNQQSRMVLRSQDPGGNNGKHEQIPSSAIQILW